MKKPHRDKSSQPFQCASALPNKRVQRVTGKLIIRDASPIVREILNRTHIDTLSDIEFTQERPDLIGQCLANRDRE
jgi:hypothetical protein